MIILKIIHAEFPKPLSSIKTMLIKEIPEKPSEFQFHIIIDQLLKAYADVLESTVLEPMEGNPIPYAISCLRKIPFSWRVKLKLELDDLVKKDKIKQIDDTPTDFVSPLVVFQKPNERIRLCVHYSKLNQYVKRPVHPFKAPLEAVSNICQNAKYFSTLDATNGYWQLELDQESQKLTTFLTPWGRYMFKRSSMGLVSSGDECCRRGDEALLNIGNIEKVFDDILVYDTIQHSDNIMKG